MNGMTDKKDELSDLRGKCFRAVGGGVRVS